MDKVPFSPHARRQHLAFLFGYSHPNACEGTLRYGFDLHFPNDSWCWAYFCVPISHLYVFLEKCLFTSFTHFKLRLFGGLLLLSCGSSLCILNINPLSDTWFMNSFSHSVGCLSILLMVSSVAHELLVSCASNCLALLCCLCFWCEVWISSKLLGDAESWTWGNTLSNLGLPQWLCGKESTCNAGDVGSNPGRIHWRRAWQPIPVFLPGDPMDWGTWPATVHRVMKSRIQLKHLSKALG